MIRSFFKVTSEWTVVRRYLVSSSSENDLPKIPRLTFSEVKKEIDKKGTVLIDVREKGELTADGKIKESFNIPLGEVQEAFNLDEKSFRKLYGFDKPLPSDAGTHLIVHCKAGVRAMKAAVALSQAGYRNIRVYDGILDWLSNGGAIVK